VNERSGAHGAGLNGGDHGAADQTMVSQPCGCLTQGNDLSMGRGIVALRQAAARLGNHRLLGCTMVATIEPCSMCAGALIHARIARLVYGASDPKAGAAGSTVQVINHPSLNHRMEVTAGVLASKCSEVLQKFFRQKRQQTSC